MAKRWWRIVNSVVYKAISGFSHRPFVNIGTRVVWATTITIAVKEGAVSASGAAKVFVNGKAL